jgi:hypothetical protein
VILFLAANPRDTDRLALDREARSIRVELKGSGYRDRFDFVTQWAAEPLDLLRELRELKPTIVHFCGPRCTARRDSGLGADPRCRCTSGTPAGFDLPYRACAAICLAPLATASAASGNGSTPSSW